MTENEIIIQKLETFAKKKKLSTRAFLRDAGLSETLIGAAKSNKGTIGLDKLIKISIKYPDIDLNWLLKKDGEIQLLPSVKVSFTNKLTATPILPIKAIAGLGKLTGLEDVKEWQTEVSYLPAISLRPQMVIKVEGDSMEPTIPSGKSVLIVPILPEEFVSNRIYVVNTTEDGVHIKKIIFDKRLNLYMFVSENPAYESRNYKPDEILALYLVVGEVNLYYQL